MHTLLPFFLALVAAIILLEMLADKLRIAYPIVLVVAGLLISFVPDLPQVHIDPDLIFFIFLPPLLFEAAWAISFKEMRKWYRIIGSFAFLVVFFTAFSVAVATSFFIPGFTLALGFLLGGIVSPPDAVSTGAIMKFVKVPRSTAAVLEGESLLNDASSLIIFRFALLAVATGQFSYGEASLSFLWMVLGGAGIGLMGGWLFIQMHRRLPTDAPSDVAFTLIEPYFLYWVAEQCHASGVLSVVCGGLLMSNRRLLFLNSTSRIRGLSVWESFVFILNGLVFLLIGLQLPEIVQSMRDEGIPLATAMGYGVLVTCVLIVARIISGYAAILATYVFRRKALNISRRSLTRRSFLVPIVIGWTGMRGVVSLAAALAIPVTLADGVGFPHRDLILFITFVVILLTLVVQGLTLPSLIRWVGLSEAGPSAEEEEAQRLALKAKLRRHLYDYLKNHESEEMRNHPVYQRALALWEARQNEAETPRFTPEEKVFIQRLMDVQRQYLVELNKDPKLDEELVRRQIYQIDLEEEQIKVV